MEKLHLESVKHSFLGSKQAGCRAINRWIFLEINPSLKKFFRNIVLFYEIPNFIMFFGYLLLELFSVSLSFFLLNIDRSREQIIEFQIQEKFSHRKNTLKP